MNTTREHILEFIEIKLLHLHMTKKQVEGLLGWPHRVWHYNQFNTPCNTWSYDNVFFIFGSDDLGLIYEEDRGNMNSLLPR